MTIAADHQPRGVRARAERALAWWFAELRALYEDAARRLAVTGRNDIVLEAGERYWILRQRQRPLGQIDRALADAAETQRLLRRLVGAARPAGGIIVELPLERVLAKRIMLPAVARGELERILHFEIARHFPFPAERVHFLHRIVGRDASAGGTIEVEIVAVPRETVAEIADALDAAGLRAKGFAVAVGADEKPLILTDAVRGRGLALTSGERALAAALILLGLAALASPVVHDRLRLEAAERESDALRPRVQAILDARERTRRDVERIAVPLRLHASRPPVVAVLDALTKAVPDGSWLLSLSLSGHELVLDGLSPSAATLALALEHSPAFAKVVFRAPILRDPATGLEHFQLAAAVAEGKP